MTITPQHAAGARFRSRVPVLFGLCAFAALAAVQVASCWRYPTDYDEGVYLQTLYAMIDGFEPYREIFLAQPPGFVGVVMPFFHLFGSDIVAARLAMVVFWALAVAGLYVVGTLLSSSRVGVIGAAFLALDPSFLSTGRTLQAETPALALAIWATAAGLFALRQAKAAARIASSAACGALLTLAIATKFIAAPVLILLGAIAIAKRPGRTAILSVVAGAITTAGFLLAPHIDALPELYDQTVRFHREAAAVYSGRVDAWASALKDNPLFSIAIIGLVIAGFTRRHLAALSWFTASAALLLVLSPLWPHHFAALAPPAALLVASLVATFNRWSTSIAVSAMALVAVTAPFSAAQRSDPFPPWVTTELRNATAGERFVVTDDQFLASTLGLRVPPELVDTSLVRVSTGYLTLEDVRHVMVQRGVRVVVLASGRLSKVPGFTAWVERSCTPAAGLIVVRVFNCPD